MSGARPGSDLGLGKELADLLRAAARSGDLGRHASASALEGTSTTVSPPMTSLVSGYGPSVITPSVATMLACWLSSPPLNTYTPASLASWITASAALATSGRSSSGKVIAPSSNEIRYCVIA